LLEHPADPGVAPFPSLFATAECLALQQASGAVLVTLDQCRFGAPSRKSTTILSTIPNVSALELRCNHKGHDLVLVGLDEHGRFRTAAAQEYPAALCEAFAQVALADPDLFSADSVENIQQTSRTPSGKPARQPDVATADRIAKWNWKETLKLSTGSDSSHINIKELRAWRLALRRAAKRGPGKRGRRIIFLNDSRVVVGAVSHGRSPSRVLNSGLRKTIPMLIGSNLYPTMLWLPTETNPADAPSRFGSVHAWLAKARREAKQRCHQK